MKLRLNVPGKRDHKINQGGQSHGHGSEGRNSFESHYCLLREKVSVKEDTGGVG